MEEALKQAASQVPALVVLVIVVVFFLKHMETRTNSMREERRELVEAIKSLNSEHIAQRSSEQKIIGENSEALRDVATSMQKLADAVHTCPLKRTATG